MRGARTGDNSNNNKRIQSFVGFEVLTGVLIVLASGISHRVIRWKSIDVCEKNIASIFRDDADSKQNSASYLRHAGFFLGLDYRL
jgi:hypothetical protein